MEVTLSRILATSAFQNLNNLNADFMKDLFLKSIYASQRAKKLFIQSRHGTKFEDRILSVIGSCISNSPNHSTKYITCPNKFKQLIILQLEVGIRVNAIRIDSQQVNNKLIPFSLMLCTLNLYDIYIYIIYIIYNICNIYI